MFVQLVKSSIYINMVNVYLVKYNFVKIVKMIYLNVIHALKGILLIISLKFIIYYINLYI